MLAVDGFAAVRRSPHANVTVVHSTDPRVMGQCPMSTWIGLSVEWIGVAIGRTAKGRGCLGGKGGGCNVAIRWRRQWPSSPLPVLTGEGEYWQAGSVSLLQGSFRIGGSPTAEWTRGSANRVDYPRSLSFGHPTI